MVVGGGTRSQISLRLTPPTPQAVALCEVDEKTTGLLNSPNDSNVVNHLIRPYDFHLFMMKCVVIEPNIFEFETIA
ncbi:hypothetical protein EYF80_047546 [Liparis tanakae]|uniref:Uncharacterized protein n=1 Tax=Liparis tanakae TaxID=230148 RepID=A0A4Z2FNB6_9TELE|nr:hypothetical protein EYF80_047546 [Liparis tanakae]